MNLPSELSHGIGLELVKATLTLGISILSLMAGWLIGQRIVADWQWRQKQRELNLAAASEFYEHYGEFLSVDRLWDSYNDPLRSPPESELFVRPTIADREAVPWRLLERATVAEAGIEAALLRLAVERCLSCSDCVELGKARQAYQQLREAIRVNKTLDWKSDSEEYLCFKSHSAFVGSVLASANFGQTSADTKPPRVPTPEQAGACQERIMHKERRKDWCPAANADVKWGKDRRYSYRSQSPCCGDAMAARQPRHLL